MAGLKMQVKQEIYAKMKRMYGVHVDQIVLHSRPIQGTTSNEYSATCSEHGVVSEWTKDMMTRTIRVRDHLKGLY